MPTLITTELVRRLPLRDTDIRDTKVTGFAVRCRASGKHTYLAILGRGRVITIGKVGILTPTEARERARQRLASDVLGDDPIAAKKAARASMTFKAFLTDRYEPWAIEHHARGKEDAQRMRAVFADFADLKLSEITAWAVEKWRTRRLKAGANEVTTNTHLRLLKAALGRATAWKLVAAHPCGSVKPITTDNTGRVRYLTPDEETRLRAALAARDTTRHARRDAANVWRLARGYPAWPTHGRYPDHLTPIVLVALNTGLRRGEILGLRGADLDLVRAQLTVRGTGAKSGQTRYVPLNQEALDALRAWPTADPKAYVFAGRTAGEPLDGIKTAWLGVAKAAKLKEFTFHDLRHTFASKLVMRGVDLNTVRELLGHADITMTLRYAHLAPAHNAAAVAKLL
jgi:integrase